MYVLLDLIYDQISVEIKNRKRFDWANTVFLSTSYSRLLCQ